MTSDSISCSAARRIFRSARGVEGDHPQKVACRFELRGDIGDYCLWRPRHLAPGGFFACVFPLPDGQRQRMVEAARAAGLTLVRERPVVFREGADPLVGLFGLMRADGPSRESFRDCTWTEPPLIIRTAIGTDPPRVFGHKAGLSGFRRRGETATATGVGR